uniref:Uncharacterized protein n=1 Tax=Setaria digitata TaxID=48799 RepID=A0A915PTT9_9BILA
MDNYYNYERELSWVYGNVFRGTGSALVLPPFVNEDDSGRLGPESGHVFVRGLLADWMAHYDETASLAGKGTLETASLLEFVLHCRGWMSPCLALVLGQTIKPLGLRSDAREKRVSD